MNSVNAEVSGLVGIVHFPVEVLGPGRRVGIWFQGCSQRCPGCISPHTQEFDERFRVSIDVLARKLAMFQLFTDKLTISGGEPFAQPEFLRALLQTAREREYRDILVYSGFSRSHLEASVPGILALIDVLIDNPFDVSKTTRLIWRGSANQNMHILTADEVLRALYEPFLHMEEEKAEVQILQVEGKTVVTGIPRGNSYLPADFLD